MINLSYQNFIHARCKLHGWEYIFCARDDMITMLATPSMSSRTRFSIGAEVVFHISPTLVCQQWPNSQILGLTNHEWYNNTWANLEGRGKSNFANKIQQTRALMKLLNLLLTIPCWLRVALTDEQATLFYSFSFALSNSTHLLFPHMPFFPNSFRQKKKKKKTSTVVVQLLD